MMQLYQYDDFGRFLGEAVLDLSAAIPANSTFVAPPGEGTAWVFVSGAWLRFSGGDLPQIYNLPPVPDEVSNIQAFESMRHFGVLPQVQAYMASLPADDLVRVTFEKAAVFKRDSPTLRAITELLGFGEVDISAMFVYAASVKV